MSKQTKRVQQPKQQRFAIQPKEEKESNNRAPAPAVESLAPEAALRLPGAASQSLRQAAVIQMQSMHGNSVVARDLEDREATGAGPVAPPSRIEGPAGSISVSGGMAEINAPAIALKAPMVSLNGAVVGGNLAPQSVLSSGPVAGGPVLSTGEVRAESMVATGNMQAGSMQSEGDMHAVGNVASVGNMTSLGNISGLLGVSTGGDAKSLRVITQDIPGWQKEKDQS